MEPAAFIHYSRSHKKMLIGTTGGMLAALKIPAEEALDDDAEKDDEEDEKLIVLDTPLEELGRFHTSKIIDIKPCGDSSQFVTIASDNKFCIWEGTQHKVLAHIQMPITPSAMDVSANGSIMFVGTEAGTFRVYDICDREKPRLLHQMKFFEEKLPISQI